MFRSNFRSLRSRSFAWDNITWGSFSLNLLMLPVIGIGALLGIRLVKLFPEKAFRRFIQIKADLSKMTKKHVLILFPFCVNISNYSAVGARRIVKPQIRLELH